MKEHLTGQEINQFKTKSGHIVLLEKMLANRTFEPRHASYDPADQTKHQLSAASNPPKKQVPWTQVLFQSPTPPFAGSPKLTVKHFQQFRFEAPGT